MGLHPTEARRVKREMTSFSSSKKASRPAAPIRLSSPAPQRPGMSRNDRRAGTAREPVTKQGRGSVASGSVVPAPTPTPGHQPREGGWSSQRVSFDPVIIRKRTFFCCCFCFFTFNKLRKVRIIYVAHIIFLPGSEGLDRNLMASFTLLLL